MSNSNGCVYLVGAGCGDADLITVRGLSLLKRCDVLVYDSLISPDLLSLAENAKEKICMGKRSGRHSASQEEINETLVKKAREGNMVVRLKGGDPFVFGRGGEEIIALKEAGIPFEEVPGISSSIAIPASAGIPVTHRKMSRGFHVVAVHTADTADGLPEDFDELARLKGTLVFLMGLSRLEFISARLIAAGMSHDTPAAVISGGNSPNPATVRGTIEALPRLALENNVKSPAVIVVGAVTELDFSATIEKPLSNIRIALTGTDNMTGKLSDKLTALGAKVSTVQRSEVIPTELTFDLTSLADGKAHWIAFTSTNGVRAFFNKLRERKTDIRTLSSCKFAVIGSETGKALESFGIIPDLVPEVFTSSDLGKALAENVSPDEDVYLFRSALGSPGLAEILKGAGIRFCDIPTYSVTPVKEYYDERLLALEASDYVIFSSAAGVRSFFEEFKTLPEKTVPVCIGKVTETELKDHTSKSFLTAEKFTAEGIVEAILKYGK